MPKKSRILVHVSDQDLAPVSTAQVEVKTNGEGKPRTARYDDTLQRYVCGDLDPGRKYRITIQGKENYEGDDRTVRSHPGDLSVFFQVAPQGTEHYLGADGEKVFFRPDSQRVLVYAAGREARKTARSLLEKADDIEFEERQVPGQPASKTQILFDLHLRGSEEDREQVIKAVQSIVDLEFPRSGLRGRVARPMIRGHDPSGREILEGLTNEIVVRFASSVTEPAVTRIAQVRGLQVERSLPWIANGWLLSRPGVPDYDILKIVDDLNRRDDVVYCEPNPLFEIISDAFTPNDFLYPEQPHFEVISAGDAWDRLDDISPNLEGGSPDICVAVFDLHGVSPNHPDLTGTLTDGSAKLVADWDFVTMTNQIPANVEGDHGTECASSAVGRFNNATGATGLAGNCKLIGAELPIFVDGVNMAEAWMWAAGIPTNSPNPNFPAAPSQSADVISNSWGVSNGPLTNAIRDGLDHLTTFGRNGRGCVVCFSIGNLGYVQFSNWRRYAAYEKTVAVGASINMNPTNPVNSAHPDPAGNTNNLPAVVDTRAFYSPFGPELDIVSPSHTCYDLNTGALVDPIVAAVRVDTGAWTGAAATVTTSNSALNPGDTMVPVASSAGFTPGEVALLENPGAAAREFVNITGVVGTQLQVAALAHPHTSGAQVSTGPNDYDRSFGGTSHSCPTVAGAAALILSVKPQLTWIQVRELLRNSATRIDGAQANAVGQWVDNDGDGVNEFSQWYGYGRLNVDRAILDTINLGATADVVIRDNLDDTGYVPSAGWHAHSPDMWVRRADDPIPALAYGDNPPHQRPRRGQDNYVFLRVKNVGTVATNEVYLRALITHYPGFEFRYPQEWMPSTRPGDPIPSPLVPGTYLIGEERIDDLAAGAEIIVKMTWDQALIPPEEVVISGTTVKWHPCLLAEVSPHDGPELGSSSGFAVKRDNNLAQRNIAIEDPMDEIAGDVAYGVMAGTTHSSGVDSIILDRSELPPRTRVFIRPDDPRVWKWWIHLFEKEEICGVDPLPPEQPGFIELPQEKEKLREVSGCEVKLLDPTRFAIEHPKGTVVVHAPKGARIEARYNISQQQDRPMLARGKYQGQEVLVFSGGGSRTLELPIRLAGGQFQPLILGLMRPKGEPMSGLLKATQKRGDGELSPGYSIRG